MEWRKKTLSYELMHFLPEKIELESSDFLVRGAFMHPMCKKKFHSVDTNTLSGSTWTNTNTAGAFSIWLFKHHCSNSTHFFGDRLQDRTSQFSSLCSAFCLCQLVHSALYNLRTCHLSRKSGLSSSTFPPVQCCWESIEPGVVLLLQPGERKMTHVTKLATGSDSTAESSPAGDARVTSEDRHEVNSSLTRKRNPLIILLRHVSAALTVWSLLLHSAKEIWSSLNTQKSTHYTV